MISVASPVDPFQPFDFRSGQFCDDALALARASGRALQECRQYLFIAEGDMAMAYELLTAGYDLQLTAPTLH